LALKAIQQFQLRTVVGTEKKAKETLRLVREAGYNGIELNGFMIKKMPLVVRTLTRMAGMPIGKSGNLDWKALIAESGLQVAGIHEDLGSILNRPEDIIAEARTFDTEYIVVPGMYRFNYSDKKAVLGLAEKLNHAGERLAQGGIRFLYHNHNCEFCKVEPGKTAYQMLLMETDPQMVGFEFDSYWPTEAGLNALELMKTLGNRMKLYHINDRGTRCTGPTNSILKSDSIELGYGNIDLISLTNTAKELGANAVILESHKNWVDNSPIKSFQLSASFMNRYV
jgi:sugar phosphate isomerase/epimerase